MGIVDEDIARVRESSDIVAVISEHVALKRVGRRWSGLCPFHAEKSPSFSVNQEEGLYYCFGCSASGDTITFVREIEHLDFVGAVEKLAAKAGVTLRYTDADEGEKHRRRGQLTDAVAAAVDFYHQRLLSSPDAAAARAYLRSRGLSGDEVRRFQIGWAPEGWDVLARSLRVRDDVWVDSGLGFINSRGRQTDAFRGRVLFPIHDASGRPVGFGGRIMPGGDGPKYKNSGESKIYAKSRTLYALHLMKAGIVEADEAVVCEGYTDVIGFAAAGVERAVATCGTALTEDHLKVLRSFARRVVLAFDADAAGQNAAERLYAWERTLDIDVAVAALPPGKDPGDLAREDPEALRRAVEEARPFLEFRVDRVLGRADMRSAEGRARAAEEALDVVAEHPSELVRDQYVMTVASRTRIDEELLREGLSDRLGGRRPSQRGPRAAVDQRGARPPGPAGARRTDRGRARRPVPGAELEALRLLVLRHEEIAASLHDVLFDDDAATEVQRALLRTGGDVRSALEMLDDLPADLLRRVAAEDSEAEAHDVVERLLVSAAHRHLALLGAQARHSEDPLAHAADVGRVKLLVEALSDPSTADEAAEQLLAWLAHRYEETA